MELLAAEDDRIRHRDWNGAGVRLLDRAGAMVKDSKKPMKPMSPAESSGFGRAVDGDLRRRIPRASLSLATISGRDDVASVLFDSSGEALIVSDSSGTIHRANPRARQILGLRQTNARGVSLGTVLAERSGESVLLLCDRANGGAKRSSVDAALPTGHPIRVTLRAVLPESKELLLCLEEGSVVQRAETQWRQVEAELRSVLDSVQAGVIVFDRAGHVRFSNAGLAQLFGIDARARAGLKTIDDVRAALLPRFRDPKAFTASWEAFTRGQGEPVNEEAEILRPASRVIERFSRPVLDGDGRAVGWLEIYKDVTGERQVQTKMLQTEKMAAVGQLVSGIAHELNNPLTAIMGYAQLLLEHKLKENQLEQAKKVHQEAERARRIVKNLLYFGRDNKPQRSQVDINEVIERALALRSYELKVENIRVTCELAQDLPRTMADPYQLQQVILNLLINAEQALVGDRGQGHVSLRTRRIPHSEALPPGRGRNERIVIEIADDGPGIPSEIAYRVFDPFFTTKPPGVGTGLGLSIVYGIVHQHGGEVTVDSQPGLGAKFSIEIPVTGIRGNSLENPPSKQLGRTASARGRILVIEDEQTVAQLIVDVLGEEGHQVDAVLDSKEGLSRISRDSYDLVVCDLRMPGLDGPGLYNSLERANSPMRKRVLFVTGDTLGQRTLEFLLPRKLPYLAKPFLVEELKLAVHELLNADETRAAYASSSGEEKG